MDSTTKPFNKKRKIDRIHSKNGKVKKLKLQLETTNRIAIDADNNLNLPKDAEKINNKVKVFIDHFRLFL